MNKRWIEEDGKYILCFTPFYEEERLAELYCDDEGDWHYSSKMLDKDDECFGSNKFTKLEYAKEYVEDEIKDYYLDEISYYEFQLEQFKR